MSYPSQLKLFKAWAKAMEQGATVGKPDYGKTLTGPRKKKRLRRKGRKRFLRRKRKKED